MRAYELSKPGPVDLPRLHSVDRLDFEPGPGEVAIDIGACAVCRTDLQIVEGDLAARRLPIVPGTRLWAGCGRSVRAWIGGSRATGSALPGWGGACGSCPRCDEGRENLCDQAEFTGWDRDGGFAESMTARADYVFRVPPGFTDAEAAPLLCGGIIGYRSLRIAGIKPGGRLDVYGFGASARWRSR